MSFKAFLDCAKSSLIFFCTNQNSLLSFYTFIKRLSFALDYVRELYCLNEFFANIRKKMVFGCEKFAIKYQFVVSWMQQWTHEWRLDDGNLTRIKLKIRWMRITLAEILTC